ncbi:MAG: 16S rRNA (adenine(1518)-N(6)/adenine(1519)-N(6))-dimethyltransferase RsmA [Bdellovibrionaceae bacterium]|nr:16S rRNA (adenine(1518)-N(6)/adenine(1519)-N(6))-dimethyltransferase RsmA [Pseudobdellovibrionaceae bacterium]
MSGRRPAAERLEAVLSRLGHRAKRSLGQNFLISDVIIDRIIAATESFQPSALIEVGPGAGALTELLATFNIPLTLIELDSNFANYWRSLGYSVIEEDALRISWESLTIEGAVLVSNLPYQISSSLVIDRSMDRKLLKGMVLMFQKEVAQRIRAQPATGDYGLLSVIAQNFWQISLVTEVGPRDFLPAPKVASRVLKFSPKETTLTDKASFLAFVKCAFSNRRKMMKANLCSWLDLRGLSEESLFSALRVVGHEPTVRAEALSPADFSKLFGLLTGTS